MAAPPFRYRRMVQFAETDMAGILHFANYLRYMEEAEHACFRAHGLRVHEHDTNPDGVWGWARRRIECDYQAPLRYEDEVDIEVTVERIGRSSIDYRTRFLLGEQIVAEGRHTVVCIGRNGDGSLSSRPIPAAVRAVLQPLTCGSDQ